MSINWDSTPAENIDMAAAVLDRRLAAADANFQHIEEKAKWVMTLSLSLGSALAAFLMSAGAATQCAGLAGGMLALCFFVSAALAGVALSTRGYLVPARIPDSLGDWKPFFEGGEHERKVFRSAQITTMHRAVKSNEDANDKKVRWLRRAILVGLLGAPIAAAVAATCFVTLLVAVPSGICPAIIGL
ncbi:MAG: hypothetical protein ACTHNH_21140 [Mesorhizobium sp.]